MKRAFAGVAGLLFLGTAMPAQERVAHDRADILIGDALIGINDIGSIVMAVDKRPRDGTVDEFYAFVASVRLNDLLDKRLRNAVITVKDRKLHVLAARDRFVAQLQLQDVTDPMPTLPRRVEQFVNGDGVQLARYYANPNEPVRLATLEVSDKYSGWPEAAFYDVHDPGTSQDCNFVGSCAAGGPGSPSCNVSGCLGHPSGCSTSCQAPLFFACCGCGPNGALCRCIKCLSGG